MAGDDLPEKQRRGDDKSDIPSMDNSSDNERAIPIAFRYVPYDQWLITHLQPSLRIDQIKLFILSKCLGTTYTPESNSSCRPPSPITFAPHPKMIERPASPIMFASPARSRPRSFTLDGDRHVNLERVRVSKPTTTRTTRTTITSTPSPDDLRGELEEEINRGYEEDDEYDTAEDDEPHPGPSFAPRTYRPQRHSIVVVSPGTLPRPLKPSVSVAQPSSRPATTSTISSSTTAALGNHVASSSFSDSTPSRATSSAPPPSPAAYTLIRFSTGQLLEDRLNLSNYEIGAYELLELHGEHSKSPTKPVFPPYPHHRMEPISHPSTEQGSPAARKSKPASKLVRHITSLDRSNVQTYVAPYWEGWVKALRVVNRDDLDVAMRFETNQTSKRPGHSSSENHGKDPSHIFGGMNWSFGGNVGGTGGMGAGFGVIVDDEMLKLRDEDVAGLLSDSGREGEPAWKKKGGKPGREPKVKLEWKERWVVVQGDTLYICKDREDVNPAQRISLSSLVTIRDKEFLLSYPSTATSPFASSWTQAGPFDSEFPESPPLGRRKDKINDHSKYVICARFRSKSGRTASAAANAEGRASPVGLSKLSRSTHRNRSSSVNTPSQAGSPTKSRPQSQTQRPEGMEQYWTSAINYYNHIALAPAVGVIPHIPSPPVFPNSSAMEGSTGAEKGTKSTRRMDFLAQESPGPPVAGEGKNELGQPNIPRESNVARAAGSRDISIDVGFPDNRHRVVSSPSPTTTSHTINMHEKLTAANPLPPIPYASSLSSDVSSPIFAHSSESDWEKAIFGANKQPYQYGYQPAYRWKESVDHGIAKDVWLQDLEKGKVGGETDDSGKDVRIGKTKYHADKRKGKERDEEGQEKDTKTYHVRSYQYEWIILDMGGSPAFNSLLRILHRGAPSVSSSFKSNYMRKISSGSGDYRTSLMRQDSGASSLSKRNRSRLQRTYAASSDIDDLHSDRDLPSPLVASTSRPDMSSWSKRLGVLPYPEWRIEVTRRAQKAALGNIGNAMLYYVFGTLELGELDRVLRGVPAKEAGMGGLPASQSAQRGKARKRTQSYASTITATSARQRGSENEDSDHLPLEIESSDESLSETEWHGWILDVARQAHGQPRQDMGSIPATEIDFPGSEVTRRAAMEPTGSVVSMSSQFPDMPVSTPERTMVADRSSVLEFLPSPGHAERHTTRTAGSPPTASPLFESVPIPHQRLASSQGPQGQPRHGIHLLHHSSSMYAGLGSEPSTRPRSRRRPSMPQLSVEQGSGHVKSNFASDQSDVRKSPATRIHPWLGEPSHGEQSSRALNASSGAETLPFSMWRSSGLVGRSASLFGGLWKKEPKEAKDGPRGGISGERGKRDKGKKKANTIESEGQKQDPGHPLTTSLPIRGPASLSLLRRATSVSSLASLEYEPPLSPTKTEAGRKRLKKKGTSTLTHEVDKIARGFDDAPYAR